MTASIALPLRIGPRTLVTLKRRLVRRSLSLDEVLRTELPVLSPLAAGDDGFLLLSLPAARLGPITARHPGLRPFVRQRYPRNYLSLRGEFDEYFARFSKKGRFNLRRTLRQFAERSGGPIDHRCYRTPAQVGEFHRHARAVSAKTYQERLLGAGLPAGETALARMRELARRDAFRGWILFLDGSPVSYIHASAQGDVLRYSHLGFDPALADLSPGTVLQLEAIRQLMEEKRFGFLDFAEGDGLHKGRFASASVDCVDLLLLRPTAANIAIVRALAGFEAIVAAGKWVSARLGLEGFARGLLRR